MIKKAVIILIIVLLASTSVAAQGLRNIEIFDINKGAVVKEMQSNPEIQKEAESYLKGITTIYVKFNPIPDKGFAVRIPLEPSIMVQNQLLNALVDEVVIIFPEQDKSFLMVFDSQNRPLFFNFEGNTDELLKKLNFHPETSQNSGF